MLIKLGDEKWIQFDKSMILSPPADGKVTILNSWFSSSPYTAYWNFTGTSSGPIVAD
mgnify:CR=1 FL=1